MNFYSALLFIPLIFVSGSFFEWTLHKYVMHLPVGTLLSKKFPKSFLIYRLRRPLDYAFIAHSKVHHGEMRSDHTYIATDENKHLITMAWWSGLFLASIHSLVSVPFSLVFDTWYITLVWFLTTTVYYLVYEFCHYHMHTPKNCWFEKTQLFQKMNNHHHVHHAHMTQHNFNVVWPAWADHIMGTFQK